MANLFDKITSDILGTSDIGKIIEPKDFDKVQGDDYILYEDGEKIYFVIKSKMDEYVFTNKALIHVDGQSAVSKKRQVIRYEYYNSFISNIILETAGTIDLDVEIKFNVDEKMFSIDVDLKQIDKLKDLYKSLVEIELQQKRDSTYFENGMESLKMANGTVVKNLEANECVKAIKELANFNFDFIKELRKQYMNGDYGYIFEKYINN